jgi:hypothetical protein
MNCSHSPTFDSPTAVGSLWGPDRGRIAWIVYSALPSASRLRTGRSGAAMAAPVATGIPWPMAPPGKDLL